MKLRGEGKIAWAYFLYRFILATVLASDNFDASDIVTYNVWALRGHLEISDPQNAPRPITSLYMRGGDAVTYPSSAAPMFEPLLDMMKADAGEFYKLLSHNPRYSESELVLDDSLQRLRVHRRVEDLAGIPSTFGKYAKRIIEAKAANSPPIAWFIPTVEDLASRGIEDILAAEGRTSEDSHGFEMVWQLYLILRGRLHEVEDIEGLANALSTAKRNFASIRRSTVAAGGVFGHSLSFMVSGYLQALGRDLASVCWNVGQREDALELAEDMQSRALTDWLARAHPSKRIVLWPNTSRSIGDIRPATLPEIKETLPAARELRSSIISGGVADPTCCGQYFSTGRSRPRHYSLIELICPA